jgi:PAS domain S-box-containing protein
MQTLEVNFKSVFEKQPGQNVLLLADAPHFTIVALSDDYCSAARIPAEKFEGRGLAEMFMEDAQRFQEEKIIPLLDSLHHVQIHKHAHSVTLLLNDQQDDHGFGSMRYYRVVNTPVFSSEGDVAYIIHNVAEVTHPEIVVSNTPFSNDIVRSNPSDVKNGTRFESVILQAPVAMGILRGENLILEIANAPMLELWGKTHDIIGQPITKALPEIANQPFPELLLNVYKTGIEYQGVEMQAFLKRNHEMVDCYFNFIYAPLKDHRGMVTGIMMVAAEVTSLVKAKKALEESEKRYRDLIANATVATAIYVGEEMTIQLANDAMLKLWGKDASVIGRKLDEAIPELRGQPFYNLLRQVYTTGTTYHSSEDKADLFVNGVMQSFYFNFTYKALRDTSGNIYGILNMAVDVSELAKAKMEIKEAEEQWRIALESAAMGTWDYYPLSRKFTCSDRTRQLFGLPLEEDLTFEKLIAAVHMRHQEKVRAEIAKALNHESRGHYRVEFAVVRTDTKKKRWLRATGQAFFNEDGIANRLTGTLLDITERKLVEEALEERVHLRTIELLDANKELERSNQDLEQYAYVASHDLQEPLRKILVYTDMLKDTAMRNSAPEYARLQKIMSSALRMSHLIQDLLNFSRLLKTENTFSNVDLNAIIQNVIDDFELKIQETDALVKVGPLPVVEASRQQMNQLFYNLISNALKFRKDGQPPVITITASILSEEELKQHKGLHQELSYFHFRVTDNGIGFNAKYARHIFEIFKRLHTRMRYEGTGIGLALCRKIVRNHRGEIYADSEEGVGSTFHVVLPAKQLAP